MSEISKLGSPLCVKFSRAGLPRLCVALTCLPNRNHPHTRAHVQQKQINVAQQKISTIHLLMPLICHVIIHHIVAYNQIKYFINYIHIYLARFVHNRY